MKNTDEIQKLLDDSKMAHDCGLHGYGDALESEAIKLGWVKSLEEAVCDCCDAEIINGKCDCAGLREMLEAGLEASGTR